MAFLEGICMIPLALKNLISLLPASQGARFNSDFSKGRVHVDI
jgi:hypothetical protein